MLPPSPEPLTSPAPTRVPVRVWDLPTRVFHWSLVLVVVALVISGNVGGNALDWHIRLGLAAGALLVFRLVWGLVGGRWSRFSSFCFGPGAIRRYLKGAAKPGDHFEVGHNPLGSLSVWALLGVLLAQVATGLVANDEIATTGPLYPLVSDATSMAATSWHTAWGKALLIVLVLLHVGAIVVYKVRKQLNLVGPMVLGDKSLPPDTPPSADHRGTRLLALVLFALCAGGAVWLSRLGA